MRLGLVGLAFVALAFSVSYGFFEYYAIRDTTFGHNPVLFSLIYPYHFAMAAVFGLTAWGLQHLRIGTKDLVLSLILSVTLFSGMLAVEDFTWFTLRAAAPVQGDMNAGKLVQQGEWTTQFMGSIDIYFTAIPNWYFLSVGLLAGLTMVHGRQRQALVART